jgi:hypothetical protein
MPRNWTRVVAIAAAVTITAALAARAGDSTASLKQGNPQIKSAGPLGFGPDGILFVGDTQGSALYAIDTGDRNAADHKAAVQVKDLSAKVAALLGAKPQQIMINDLAVNPLSGSVYLSVSRGRGPDAAPALMRLGSDGKLEEINLESVKFARAEIPNTPGANATERGQSLRNESITDIAYVDGRVFIAGLSNEEFSSRLIAIPYPFSEGFDGASIEIYHASHGHFETKSPVRTFVPYKIGNDPYLLAAYTCTPLVKVPVAELKAGAHVKGTTIAELGNGNRPLDMIAYGKDGKSYLLLANNKRGVMKIPTETAGEAPGLTAPVQGTKGIGYDTIASLKGVVQMDKLDAGHAVILVQDSSGALNLETVELP